MFSKEKFLPFIMFFLLVVSITAKGRDCLRQAGGDVHIEASHEMMLFSDLISVLGEGIVKAPLSANQFLCHDFQVLDPFSKVGSSFLYTYYFLVDKPLSSLNYRTVCNAMLPDAPIFLCVRAILI